MADQMTLEEQIAADPEFAQAFRNAQNGEFATTLFEQWDVTLTQLIDDIQKPMSMTFADAVMRQWPWLTYEGVKLYQEAHQVRLQSILDALRECYPKPAKHLFKENVADWEKHKPAYLDVLVAWTKLSSTWPDEWQSIPLDDLLGKGAEQASITVATALLLSDNGLIENIRNLAGYEITDEEGAELDERISGVSDE